MCGIAGIISKSERLVAEGEISALTDALAHRGPDGRGLWTDATGRVSLGHRRLAIIDTGEGGRQPMLGEGGRHVIVYNGEVFNFVELRDDLERLGQRFAGHSDTEVILAAWARWGADMLQRFNGMWALAIYDNASGELFLARDRFGVKPLLYADTPERFVFASEMKALRASGLIDMSLDMEVARRLLLDPFGIEGGERTVFARVRRLPAGHWARLRRGVLQVGRWWRTTDHLDEPAGTPGQHDERFRELFLDAVRLRMRSDVPIGTCLSGGFDSSAVVGAMAHCAAGAQSGPHFAGAWRRAFIASFPGQDNDETPQALEAAAFAQVAPVVMNVGEADALHDVDRVLHDLDDIYIGLPTAPWLIYRHLRRHQVVVSLDGHGADELMGGYRKAGGGLAFALRNAMAALSLRSRWLGRCVDLSRTLALRVRGQMFLRGSPPPALASPCDADPLPGHWSPFNRRLYRMFHATVLPTILRNFDRLSMAHGIEVRMPFMDWRLVCFTMGLPDAEKSAKGMTKAVARRALVGILPDSIRLSPRKVGFNSPMPGWLNGPLRPWTESLLRARCDEFDAIVDAAALSHTVAALNAGRNWSWESAGRIWPYLHMKWMLTRGRSA